jgi:GT2 family glycosyltransferase
VTLPVTAIIVSHNSASALPACIGGLRRHLAPEQVLVIDNASTDTSVAVASMHGAEVIVSHVNQGFGAGCNLGAEFARNDLLLFINPDVCIMSVGSKELRQLTERRPLGLIAPQELVAQDMVQREPAMRTRVPWPFHVAREALGPVLPHEIAGRLSARATCAARRAWLSGALLLSARNEFLELGGFNERLFMYYEDRELSARYVKAGLPLTVTSAVSARHIRGASAGHGDRLRRVPTGASAMSSIEVVGINHGPLAGRCAWALYHGLQRCALLAVWLTAKGPLSARSARKRDELHSTQRAAAILLQAETPHYPLVKTFARGRKRNFPCPRIGSREASKNEM